MERMSALVTDPAVVLSTLQEKGQHVLELVRSHPWTSLSIVAGTALVWSYVRAPRNLPPGPRGLPVVGALSCYSENLPEKLLEWRKQYGDVISFYKLGRLNVILNSERSIRDAFSKQGDEFGHRAEEANMARLGIRDEIFGKPYDDTWKKNKKFAMATSKSFGFGTVRSEGRMQDQFQVFEEFLLKQNGSPTDVSEELKLVCAAVISSMVLGTSESWQEADPARLATLTGALDEAFNAAFVALVSWQDYVHPKLAYVFTRRLRQNLKERTEEVVLGFLLPKIKKAAVDISDQEPQNMIEAYLQERGTTSEAIVQMGYTLFVFLLDAIQGTSITMTWCLLHMILQPELQQQIYSEINTACGSGRVPGISDKDKLPTIQALIHEVLRTMIAFPLSMQRLLHQDVKVYGFTLPKGAIVAANHYSVQFDPEVFPDPDKFLPSRFLNKDGSFNATLGSKVMAFSLGPRKCLGEAFARQQIYLFLARLVQRFELRQDPDSPTPSTEKTYNSSFPQPHSYKLCFTPR